MSASLKARLQKAEAELEVGVSRQRHLQVHLDSAATHNSALSQELEVELQNNAEMASECKVHQAHCIQVTTAFDSIVMTAHCTLSEQQSLVGCVMFCLCKALLSSQASQQPASQPIKLQTSKVTYCVACS